MTLHGKKKNPPRLLFAIALVFFSLFIFFVKEFLLTEHWSLDLSLSYTDRYLYPQRQTTSLSDM